MFRKIHDIFIQLVLYLISPFIIKKEPIIIFGSWCGDLIIDNSFYLANFFDVHCKCKMYWIGKKHIENDVLKQFKNIKFADMNKFSTLILIKKSSVYFHTQMIQGDLPPFNIYNKGLKIHLLHGLALKKVYYDVAQPKLYFLKKVYYKFLGISKPDDYYLSSSYKLKKHLASAFREKNMDAILEYGSPRNDFLLNLNKNDIISLKKKYSQLLNVDLFSKKIVLYSPTYRRKASNNISLSNESNTNFKKLIDILHQHNAIVIEKKHYVGIQSNKDNQVVKNDSFFVVDSISNLNFQELLAISDVLISDYSGAILDFALLRRPQISYVFDYDYYKDVDSGLYFSVDEYSPGDISFNFTDLLDKLSFILQNGKTKRDNYENVIDNYLSFEKGDCSAKLYKFLITNKILEEN